LKQILPQDYTYLITNFENLPSYQTQEGFEITNFELEAFVNVDSKEGANKWLATFQT